MDKNLYTLSEISLYSSKRNDGNSLPNISSWNSDTKRNSEDFSVQEKIHVSNLDGNLQIPDSGSDEEFSYSSMDNSGVEELEKTVSPVEPRYYKIIILQESTRKENTISEPKQQKSWKKSWQDVSRYFRDCSCPCIRLCVDI